MGDLKQQGALNLSDLASTLPADAAGNKAGLLPPLEGKLQSLTGRPASIVASLPGKIRKRVEVLREIQHEHDELETKFFEERAALEAKYQKLYEPLYTKRYDIVNSIVEVDGVSTPDGKGVPLFWLTCMKRNEVLSEEITERDEDALRYLRDIKWFRIKASKGFKLAFFFGENPYFKNTLLTKTYYMIDEDEPILEKAIGTEIEWNPGKCLTQKVLKKKPKKGSKNAKPVTKTEVCESFFNFFSPPVVPDDDDELDEDMAEELQNQMENDYDIGSTIRDKIIPHAVSWFTGEAIDGDDFGIADDDDDDDDDDIVVGDDDDDDDDEDDDENDDDDDDEDDEDAQPKKKNGASTGGGPQGDRPAECKQQ